ncbi:hypothetical protein QE152_g886 [Popillia japonica]|uniref:Uncharacterized protein n=1 Tax=Popillia japonica TaxID=7064 RepID=A0AAW1NEP7_POPJA
MLSPYPKASARKVRVGRRRGRPSILTDTPEEEEDMAGLKKEVRKRIGREDGTKKVTRSTDEETLEDTIATAGGLGN